MNLLFDSCINIAGLQKDENEQALEKEVKKVYAFKLKI